MHHLLLAATVSLCVISLASTADLEPTCKYKEKNYRNGETWAEKGAFKMRCVIEPNGSWRTEVAGCTTPEGIEVSVNGTRADGQNEWICDAGADGSISLKQKRGKRADCDNGRKNGERWVEKSFEFECAEGGIPRFVGCVVPNGEKIPDGQVKEVNGIKMECKQHANGTVALVGLPKEQKADCVATDGTRHPNGATWLENVLFEYKCADYGIKKIKGCVVKEVNLSIPINESRSAERTVYHCEERDGSYRFYTSQKA